VADISLQQHPDSYGRGAASGADAGNKYVAQAGLALIAAAVALDAVAFFIDVLIGLRMVEGLTRSEIGFAYSSSLSRASNLAIPAAVALGGAAFVWWFQGAYRHRAARKATRFKPAWAVLGWVVPGLNLFRPPQMMSEITGRSPLVAPWWTFWAIGGLSHVALRLITPSVQRGWVYWQTAAFIANLVLLASLALAFTLVNEAQVRIESTATRRSEAMRRHWP